VAGLVAAAWLAYRGNPVGTIPLPNAAEQDTDPRRAYAGPYLNIDPAVQYVGDSTCGQCHLKIAESYAHHPMGRSLVPATDVIDRQGYGPDTNNPFVALGRHFQVIRQGDAVRHQQAVLDDSGKPMVELSQDVRWVMGSGMKGSSYLTERDRYLLQTPISWYTQKQRWDLSPGFVPSVLAGRVVSAACLYCHANRVRGDSEVPDHFSAPIFEGHAIGCERCHGPAQLHVARGDRYTIVNPARLSAPLRDAVCEQCHLEGEARVLRFGRELFDYRPGLPLSDFWAVLVHARQSGEDAKAVNHVEQMYQSKCFQRPVGELKLGCITCHDPHVRVSPEKRVAHYRESCLKCHDEAKKQAGCSVPLQDRRKTSPGDSCIDCHMPRYESSDVVHTASTDHRIVRRPTNRPRPPTDLDNAVFVDFYRDRFAQGDIQAEGNLGIGLVKMMNAGMFGPERQGERALRLLESALATNPQDVELRVSKAQVLARLGRHSEVLAEASAAIAKRPRDWRLLACAAAAAQGKGDIDLAIDYWRRAVDINPNVPDYQVSLVALLLRKGELNEARNRCEKLLQRDPFNVSGRQAWIGFLLQDGQKTAAQHEFEIIRRLNPPDLAQREEWFRKQLR
jgi:hypothetical protein